MCSKYPLRALLLLMISCNVAIGNDLQADRRLKSYLAVFLNGYGNDGLPEDDGAFEKLLTAVKTKGHFNAILCRYTPSREALCRKYEMGMVVDLLGTPHVYQDPQGCEKLLKSMRGNPTVVAYHLWSDRIGKSGPGRARDIDNVHAWDPTHPTWAGTYRSEGIDFFARSDIVSYYDFSWKRGPEKNFPHLLSAWNVAKVHGNRLGRYCETDPGLPGKGNPNRVLYVQTTSIACGLRASMWHIGSRIMDMKTFEFNQFGKDLAWVNQTLAPIREQIAKLGLPTAIYSTTVRFDPNHRPLQQAALPPGLEKNAFPADFWIQPVSGDFVGGFSTYDESSRRAAFFANHDAYAEQSVKLRLRGPAKPQIFNPAGGKFERLKSDGDQSIEFKLAPAGGAILLFD